MNKFIGFFLIIIVMIILGVVFFLVQEDRKMDKQADFTEGQEDGDNGGDSVTYTVGGKTSKGEEEASDGSRDGGSAGEEIIDSTCPTQQIAYSLEFKNVDSVCNEYQGEICVRRTIDCSIRIYNRDNELDDYFEMKLLFLGESGDKTNPIDQTTSKVLINAGEYELFGGTTTIESYGIDGFANQEVNCLFNTVSVPQKQFC